MFFRVICVALTVTAVWWSSSSLGLGLGLGELKVNSNLASPLKASITLRGMDGVDLDPEQFSIRIDSDSNSKIEYRLLRIDANTAVIDLYTREVISEPLFQFRIEVKWDRSAVARSYDVLVDPPNYQEYFSVAEQTETNVSSTDASTAQSNAQEDLHTQLEPIALSDVDSTVIAATETPVNAPSVNVADVVVIEPRREYGPTIGGNSIWRVARATATDNRELTIYQWMYAIWNVNPHAFTGDNMHRLNMGKILSIPLENEVGAASHSEAWRAYSSQMAMLQTAASVSAASATPVERAGPEMVQQEDSQQVVMKDEVVQGVGAEVAMVDKTTLAAVDEIESLAVKQSLIALVEESASAIDEEAVVTRQIEPGLLLTEFTVPVGKTAEVETLETTGDDNSTNALAAGENQPGDAGAVGGLLSEDEVLPAAIEAVAVREPVAAITNQAETATDNVSAPVSMIEPATEEWSSALQSRRDFIDQLPLIGAAGSLAFVGRAVQGADKYIATSPSWVTLAFGAWVTLVFLMLRKELLTRRAAASAAPAPASVSADRPVGKRRAEDQTDFTPEVPPNDANAHEIIAQAKSIQARGDIEEAIKLMCLAVGLQPNQPKLVIHLLELYHKTRQAELFAELMDDCRTVLEAMSPSSQIHLHVMHTQLCPDLVFPLRQADSINNNDVVTEDLPESEIDEARRPDEMAEVDSPTSGLEPEFEIEMEDDDESALDTLATRASDSFDDIHIDDDEDEAYFPTQVILTDNGLPLRDEAMPMAGQDGEIHDMAVILKEADVYLTYGLYDNAQELLLRGMELDPERADFLARLLDSYYATRNVVDFVAYAKVMLDMGDTGKEYWDKVKTMGYELSPLNKMFADGKDGSLSAAEREIHTGVMVGEILDLEVTLKEADVYLAYGLYDNAQELLLRGMELDPERADFLARLLDSYYATRNVVDFVAYAKVMLDMGDIGSEYWDKVETMGYELAPFNKMFAGGKDMSLSTVEREIPKPETADIDFSDIEEDSEAAFADIEADGDDDSSPTDLNFDLELNEFDDPVGDELDDLIIELDQSEESEVSDIPDSEAALVVNLEPTADDLDAVLAVNAEATEDELDAMLAAEIQGDDKVIDLDYGEEDTIAVDLEATEDELDAVLAAEIQDDDEVIDLDYGEEDAVQFTMEEEIKSEQLAAADGDDTKLVLVEEPKPDSLSNVKLDSGDGRIFYFPDNPSEDKEFDEFESEVKMTLQAIRDQLQNMTERLFHQERATNDLQQTIAELKDDSSASGTEKSKKSS